MARVQRIRGRRHSAETRGAPGGRGGKRSLLGKRGAALDRLVK